MVLRVWIADGCISCGWCQSLSQEIFILGDSGMEIRADARTDHLASPNRVERSTLTKAAKLAVPPLLLQFIADGCPSQVITFDPPVAASPIT